MGPLAAAWTDVELYRKGGSEPIDINDMADKLQKSILLMDKHQMRCPIRGDASIQL